MRNQVIAAAGAALALMLATAGADAQCVNKGAKAYAGSEASAKWYAMETMVQDVSWGLWPGFLQANPEHTAHYKVAGYKITNERYQCKPEGGQVLCRGRATFCKTG